MKRSEQCTEGFFGMETRFPDVGFRVGPLLSEGLSAKPITPRRILLWNSLSLSQPRRGLICRLRHFGYTPYVAAGHEAPLDPTEIQENKSFKRERLRDSQLNAPRLRLQGIPNLTTREVQRRPVQPPAPPEPAKKEDILSASCAISSAQASGLAFGAWFRVDHSSVNLTCADDNTFIIVIVT